MAHQLDEADQLAAHLSAIEAVLVAVVADGLSAVPRAEADAWIKRVNESFKKTTLRRGPAEVERLTAFIDLMQLRGKELLARVQARIGDAPADTQTDK